MKTIQKNIFILDDEHIHSDLLKTHLNSLGYKVEVFHHSEQMFEKLEIFRPEIIFLDYNLDEGEFKNGVDILAYLKKIFPATEVVIYSGQENIEVATDTIKHGAYDYIVKGTTAIHKAEIVVENIVEKNINLLENKRLKLFTYLLGGFLLLFITITFYL